MKGRPHSSGLSAFYRDVARNESLWTASDTWGQPLIIHDRGRLPVRPFWSTEALARELMESAPGYDGCVPVEVPWNEFRDRVLPQLEGDGMLAGINWSGARSLGCDVRPGQVFQAVESAMARLKPWEWERARTNRRRALLRHAGIGALLGGWYAFQLASITDLLALRSVAMLVLGPVTGAAVAVELQARSGWEGRGVLWALARYALSFASAAGIIYAAGSWIQYPWSWAGFLLGTGAAALFGTAVRVTIAFIPVSHPPRSALEGRRLKRRRRYSK